MFKAYTFLNGTNVEAYKPVNVHKLTDITLHRSMVCSGGGGGGGGGGELNFFQLGVCGPDFRSVGLANWHLPLKKGAWEQKISKFGGLWAENFQIWGLVS